MAYFILTDGFAEVYVDICLEILACIGEIAFVSNSLFQGVLGVILFLIALCL